MNSISIHSLTPPIKILTTTVLVVLIMITLQAQDGNDLNQQTLARIQDDYLVLPSAEGTALGKYGEYNVNLYTGVPTIPVQLYTIAGHQLSYSLGLQYNASGIKVSDAATAVGIGWKLMSQPMVSRVVSGDPDMNHNYYNHATTIKDGLIIPQVTDYDEIEYLYEVARANLETQPDQFYYDLNGRSGNFYIDPEKTIIQAEHADIIINPTFDADGDIVSFEMIDEHGRIYTFDITERTSIQYDDNVGSDIRLSRNTTYLTQSYNSSWYASTIESYDQKERLDFSYLTASGTLAIPVNYDLFTSEVFQTCTENGSSNTSNMTVAGAPSTSTFIQDKRYLDEIKYSIGNQEVEKLDFNLSDVTVTSNKYATDMQLDKVALSKKGTSGTLKEWGFIYNDNTGRLTLESITEKSGMLTGKKHEFGYYATHTLPEFTSSKIDHWGYHNNGSALLPSYSSATGQVNSSNRNTDPNRVKAGSLSSITYPTGGKTEFTMESHSRDIVELSGGYTDITNGGESIVHESCDFTLATCCSLINGDPEGSQIIETVYITRKMIDDGYLLIDADFIDCTNGGPAQRVVNMVQFEIEFLSLDLSTSYGTYHSPSGISTSYSDHLNFSTAFTINTPGTYRIRVFGSSTKVIVTWQEEHTSTTVTPEYVGGLRIADISHFDTNGNIIKQTKYDYTRKITGASKASTAKLFSEPNYLLTGSYIEYKINEFPPSSESDKTCITATISSTSQQELIHVQGSPIGYSKVTEIPIKDFNNTNITYGKTVHHFHNKTFDNTIADPVLNGLLRKKEIFDNNGKCVLAEQMQYSTDDGSSTQNTRYFGYTVIPDSDQDNQVHYMRSTSNEYIWTEEINEAQQAAEFRTYKTKLKRKNIRRMEQNYVHPKRSRSSRYYYNGNTLVDSFAVEEITQYQNPIYLSQPTHQTISNSDGTDYETRFFYINDYQAGTIKNNMSSRHILLPAWKTEQYVTDNNNTYQSDGYRSLWAQSLGSIYPETEQRYEMTFNAAGAVSAGSWQNQRIIKTRDSRNGLPISIEVDGWDDASGSPIPIQLSWSNTGKLTSQTFSSYVKLFAYGDDHDLISKYTNHDNTSQSYTYDALLRPMTIKDDQRNVTTTIDYHYSTSASDLSYRRLSTKYAKLGSQARTLINLEYVNGLGWPIQSKRMRQGPTATQSILHSTGYDSYGRPILAYEPQLGDNSESYESPSSAVTTTMYEDHALSRKLQTIDAAGFTSSYTYGSNDLATDVPGYPVHSLDRLSITDGRGHIDHVYTDRMGRSVMKIRENGDDNNEQAKTQTMYDHKHRPTKVIPPDASSGSANLIYTYLYDADDMVREKKISDAQKIEYRYDDRDLLLYQQDGLQRSQNRWYGFTYDEYGKVLQEGWASSVGGAITAEISNTYGTGGISIDKLKSQSIRSTDGTRIYDHSYSYYNTGLLKQHSYEHLLIPDGTSVIDKYSYDSADNILTESHDMTAYTADAFAYIIKHDYDHAGRAWTQTYGQGQIPADRLCTKRYTVRDQVDILTIGDGLQEVNYKYLNNGYLDQINGSALSGTDLFQMNLDYDDASNIDVWQWRSSGLPNRSYAYSYNFLNQIEAADMHGSSTNAYSAAYTYNDYRGNLKTIDRVSSDNNEFIDKLTLNYIAGTNKMTNISDTGDPGYVFSGYVPNSSSYTYDQNGNITNDPPRNAAVSYEHFNLPRSIISTANNSSNVYQYDMRGTLHRTVTIEGGVTADDRHYIGNVEYVNGQLYQVKHDHGFIKLSPMPQITTFRAGNKSGTEDTYCRDITSWEVGYPPADVDLYFEDCGNLTYGFEVKLGAEYLITPKPFAKEDQHWFIEDHLGNTRVIFKNNSTISQRYEYYPFGMRFDQNSLSFNYTYNGKEEQRGLGEGLMAYGARFYDPAIARWTSVDPLAEVIPEHSPYAYVFNNPINFNDPTGMMGESFANEYDAEVNEDGTVNFVYVSDKGGDDIDYINWKDSNGNSLGTTEHVVGKEYNSGPGTSYTQQSNPTPGHRVIHGSTPLVFEAVLYLSGEKLLAKLGGWLWGLRAAKGTAPLALGTTRMRLLRNVQNPRLKKMIEVLYRDGAKYGNGSTGSMIREELINGTITSASGSHLIKAQGALNSMRKLLKGNYGTLSGGDRKIVFEVIEDLTRGTGLKW